MTGTSTALTSLLLACALGGCGSGDAGSSPDQSSSQLAFAEDFRGYHGWNHYGVERTSDALGVHTPGHADIYLKELPPSGASEFPLGTLIVKEMLDADPPQIFARSKRGGNYNAGAPGWEWFELQNLNDNRDGVLIVWRGVGPPAGEMYGGDPTGCNNCHASCGNDSVCSPPLQLSNF